MTGKEIRQMRIDILTLFPAMFSGPFGESIVARARANGILDIEFWNPRDYSTDRHHTVDDTPYGGGTGMVMKLEPLTATLDQVLATSADMPLILVTSPQGELLTHQLVQEVAQYERLVIVCGHYEGIDERLHSLYPTREFSIGDYVLTGGELPAMVLVDAVSRFLPGVLGDLNSALTDCFSDGIFKYPQYTRPESYRGQRVPEILLSGHHEQIRIWRRKESLRRTLKRRPDLLDQVMLSQEDRQLLAQVREEQQ
jgi:tRNA (guanine37-N1)-methyltransferase